MKRSDECFDASMAATTQVVWTTRQYGGAGLGLAITKKFCQMMGGDVNVESELGQGATFTIRLPVEVTAPSAVTCLAV